MAPTALPRTMFRVRGRLPGTGAGGVRHPESCDNHGRRPPRAERRTVEDWSGRAWAPRPAVSASVACVKIGEASSEYGDVFAQLDRLDDLAPSPSSSTARLPNTARLRSGSQHGGNVLIGLDGLYGANFEVVRCAGRLPPESGAAVVQRPVGHARGATPRWLRLGTPWRPAS